MTLTSTAPPNRWRLFAAWTGMTMLGVAAGLVVLRGIPEALYFGLMIIAGLLGACTPGPDCGPIGLATGLAFTSFLSLLPQLIVGLAIGLPQGWLLGGRGAIWRNALAVVAGLCVARGLYDGQTLIPHQLTSYFPPVPFWGALVAALGGGLAVGLAQSWQLWGRGALGADRRGALAWVLSTGLAWLLAGAAAAGIQSASGNPFLGPNEEVVIFLVAAGIVAVITGAAWAARAGRAEPSWTAVTGLAVALPVLFAAAVGLEGAYRAYRLEQILAPYQRPDWSAAAATPGMALTLTETGRAGPAGQTQVTYTAAVTGLPRDEVYTLWQMPLDGTPVVVDELVFSDAGELVSQRADSTWPTLVVSGYARAQAYSLALMNARETVRVFAKVFPFPIEATGAGGCRMWLELYNERGTHFLLDVVGFEPEEKVDTSFGVDPVEPGSGFTVDEHGAYHLSLLADPDEYDGKHSAYTVVGEKCTVSVEYDLGVPAMDPQ